MSGNHPSIKILVDLGVGREHEFAPREVIPPIFTPNHSWVAEGTNIANSEAGYVGS